MTTTLQPPASARPDRLPPRRRVGFALLAAAGVLVALAVIAWTAFAALSVLVRQESTATSDYSGVRAISVDAGPADVTVTGAASDTVRLDETRQWSFRRPSTSVTRTGDHLTIHARCPIEVAWSCSVHLNLQVPATTRIDVHSGDGDVTVQSIRTDLVAQSGSGDIRVEDVTGDVTARSDDGDVTVIDTRARRVKVTTGAGDVAVRLDASPKRVQVSSGDGDVVVLVPDEPGVAYRVDTGGDRSVSVHVDTSATRHITARSGEGDVRVAYRA